MGPKQIFFSCEGLREPLHHQVLQWGRRIVSLIFFTKLFTLLNNSTRLQKKKKFNSPLILLSRTRSDLPPQTLKCPHWLHLSRKSTCLHSGKGSRGYPTVWAEGGNPDVDFLNSLKIITNNNPDFQSYSHSQFPKYLMSPCGPDRPPMLLGFTSYPVYISTFFDVLISAFIYLLYCHLL